MLLALFMQLLLVVMAFGWLPHRAPRSLPFSLSAIATAARQSREFSRTNRVELKWLQELCVLRNEVLKNATATSTATTAASARKDKEIAFDSVGESSLCGINLIIELGKELLYSNIPEQIIDLYSMYHEVVFFRGNEQDVRGSGSSSIPIVPNTKILSLCARALITLDDSTSALRLLQSVARAGVDFDSDEMSVLIADLAKSSSKGLQTALMMRNHMKKRGEILSVTGTSNLMAGIYKYGLQRTREAHLDLLVKSTHIVDDDGVIIETSRERVEDIIEKFYISTQKAEEIAMEVLFEHMKARKNKLNKLNAAIVTESLRVLFKAGSIEYKGTFDKSNYEPDEEKETQQRILAGVVNVIDAMIRLKIQWNVHICDMLLDECLKAKDLEGVRFVCYVMDEVGLDLQTSSLNVLMQRYAENGDAESAYNLMRIMEGNDNRTIPNKQTYKLLLKAGNKSTKGRYYSQLIFTDMIANKTMDKTSWDRLVELAVLTDKAPDSVFASMRGENCQPDQDTLVLMFRALLRKGEVDKAMKWYRRLKRGDKALRLTKEKFIFDKLSNSSDEKAGLEVETRTESDAADLYLPFPGKRVVVILLEYLRDKGLHKEALYILEDLSGRTMLSFQKLEEKLAVKESKITLDETEKEVKVYGNTGGKKVVIVKALSKQAKEEASKRVVIPTTPEDAFLCSQYTPDEDIYSLVMEACIISNNPALAMQVFNDMENAGLISNRRIYALLIRIFGALGDTESALGVFEEMRLSLPPDVDSLQSILQVCMEDPLDLRQAAFMLESMANEGVDLDIYSKDILMDAFPDANILAENLALMQQQPISTGLEVAKVSLSVVSCLVQAARKKKGLTGIIDAMEFLGKVGIRLDMETNEYFTIPDVPIDDSKLSRHYREKLLPHKEKVRSLMNIEMPVGYQSTFDVENRFYISDEGRLDVAEPYFEYGKDSYREFSSLLLRSICGDMGCSVDLADNNEGHEDHDDNDNAANNKKKRLELGGVAVYLDSITKELSEESKATEKKFIGEILKRPPIVSESDDQGRIKKKNGMRVKGGRKSLKMIITEANDENSNSAKFIPMKLAQRKNRKPKRVQLTTRKEKEKERQK